MSTPMPTKSSPHVKKSRTPRKSPLQQAILAAEKAVLRAQKRKIRGFARIAKLEKRIAEISGSAGQFDSLIAQLQANASNLRRIAGALPS